jgi:hypothetical protein
MKSNLQPSTQEVLAGLVERVTFHNAENGFCVLRAKARGHRDLVTVVGHAATISAGEWITAVGEWTNDRAHGQQFKARFLKTSAPSSIDGIEKYLGSGMIRGIGPGFSVMTCTALSGASILLRLLATAAQGCPHQCASVDGVVFSRPPRNGANFRMTLPVQIVLLLPDAASNKRMPSA